MRIASLVVFAIACGSPSKPAPIVNTTTTTPTAKPTSTTRGLEFRVVDSNSTYMQRLYQRVGGDKPSDPLAISSGVSAELDMWADTEGQRHHDFYLAAKDRASIERYVATLAAKDHSFILPTDREFGYEKVSDKAGEKWRTYYLEKTASITGAAIATAYKSYDPNTSRAIVLLDFDSAGTQALAELTKRIVGQKLAIVFKGVVRSAPVITGEIAGGKASIMMGGSDPSQQEKDADELVDTLKLVSP